MSQIREEKIPIFLYLTHYTHSTTSSTTHRSGKNEYDYGRVRYDVMHDNCAFLFDNFNLVNKKQVFLNSSQFNIILLRAINFKSF